LVFKKIDKRFLQDENFDFDDFLRNFDFKGALDIFFERLFKTIEFHYDNAMTPTLFKNRAKCEHLLNSCKKDNVDDPTHPQLSFAFQEI
jgi:hypothetical protein